MTYGRWISYVVATPAVFLAERLGLDPADLTYADFDQILSGWLESRPVART
jgi:hypothetical protein